MKFWRIEPFVTEQRLLLRIRGRGRCVLMFRYLDEIWNHLYTGSNTCSGDEKMDSREIEKRMEEMEAAE